MTATAISRSLAYLEASASGSTFDAFGHDYLLCLDGVARRLPADGPHAALAGRARGAARRLGERWLASYLERPSDATDPASLRDRIFGLFALRRAGLKGPALDKAEARIRSQLQLRPGEAAASSLLPFDPQTEPPPEDVHPLPRSHALAAMANNRFSAWQLALSTAQAAEELRLPSAPQLHHVMQWLPSLGPYVDAASAESYVGFHDQAYALVALTHALTDYGARGCGRTAGGGGGGGRGVASPPPPPPPSPPPPPLRARPPPRSSCRQRRRSRCTWRRPPAGCCG